MPQLLNLKRDLIDLKQDGRKFLSIDKLIRYCDIEIELSETERNNLQAQADYEHKMELWREDAASSREGVRIVNDSAFQALKTLTIVSGGAAAALLAFIGSVWPTASLSAKAFFSIGLSCFGGSLIGAALAYGLTYLCLLCFFELDRDKTGSVLRLLIVLLVVGCYISLGVGFIQCFYGLHR